MSDWEGESGDRPATGTEGHSEQPLRHPDGDGAVVGPLTDPLDTDAETEWLIHWAANLIPDTQKRLRSWLREVDRLRAETAAADRQGEEATEQSDRFRRKAERLWTELDAAEALVVAEHDRADAAEADLVKYGDHDRDCGDYDDSHHDPCNCGWADRE